MADIPVWRHFASTPAPKEPAERVAVLIVGAGPVGLTLALDLARKGHRVTVLNRLECIPAGSKAICFSKRTLDIWQRLGVAAPMLAKGVTWNVGKVFWRASAEPVFQFDMLPVKGQQMPAFINLQQYHVEEILLEEISRHPNIEIRWGHCLETVQPGAESVRVGVECGGGRYEIECAWLVACDGHRSTVRRELGLDFEGRIFEENFLIADIRMHEERPSERWFWFDPPFNPGKSALLHKQPDDVWRLDFQLGWNIDRSQCTRPDYVEPLIRGMLGPEVEFSREWYSVYTFQCRRMRRFVHGRVIFAGDSAHLVSPFGARGCNGGIADADNLAWKLDLVLRGRPPQPLLESYNHEATVTADENILYSSRSTDFMTPKSVASRALRDATLELASQHRFARPFVNSGRLSTAVNYPESPMNTADEKGSHWRGIAPGSPALDARLAEGWLLDQLGGRFVLLSHGFRSAPQGAELLDVGRLGHSGSDLLARYDLAEGNAYLIRPDQYVAARWRSPTTSQIAEALARARGA
jgi:3-(3-hydroxy-phenyl)propionate hydroxylase